MLAAATLAAETTVFAQIPQDLQAQPGQVVVAPVQIDDAAGIRGAEIRIAYDTNLLDTSNLQIQAGSLWPDANTEVVANVNDATGTIIVWVFHPEALPTGAGSLLDVQFLVRDDASPGTTTNLDFTFLQLNEGDPAPNPAPIEGQDPADGRIAIGAAGGNEAISGFVYADTNTNDQPDEFEGVPLVTITLVDSDSGETQQTVTDDQGRYDFGELAPGSYEIRQTQPAAFLDGGPNSIQLTVAEGQQLADQNFRELGLRPEYVYSRLFTTPVMPIGSVAWRSAIRDIVSDAEQDAATTQAASSLAIDTAGTSATATPDQAADSEQAAQIAEAEPPMPAGAEGEAPDTLSALPDQIAPDVAAAASVLAVPAAEAEPASQAASTTAYAAQAISESAEVSKAPSRSDAAAARLAAQRAPSADGEGEAEDAGWTVWAAPSRSTTPATDLPLANNRPVKERAEPARPAPTAKPADPAKTATSWHGAPVAAPDPQPGLEVSLASATGLPTPNSERGSTDDTSHFNSLSPADARPQPAIEDLRGGSISGQDADLVFAIDELGLLQ